MIFLVEVVILLMCHLNITIIFVLKYFILIFKKLFYFYFRIIVSSKNVRNIISGA